MLFHTYTYLNHEHRDGVLIMTEKLSVKHCPPQSLLSCYLWGGRVPGPPREGGVFSTSHETGATHKQLKVKSRTLLFSFSTFQVKEANKLADILAGNDQGQMSALLLLPIDVGH